MTIVERIDMSLETDLDKTIRAVCEGREIDNYKLAATFVLGTQLILIFQD